MKIGSIVKLSRPHTIPLYGGDNVYCLIHTDILFNPNDLGTVLSTKKLVAGKYSQSYVKILSSNGIGWCFQNQLELVLVQSPEQCDKLVP